MTHKQRFIETLKGNPIGGQVPHFEIVFFLTMEALGKIHPSQRAYYQWNQMSYNEKKLHIVESAEVYIDTAKKYDHSGIFVHPNPGGIENTQWLLETIREKTGDEYYITMHGDPTFAMPDGDNMIEFTAQMYEEPEVLHEQSKRSLDYALDFATQLHHKGHLCDGFTLCSDYALNANPFFTPSMFGELIQPYLKDVIAGYREMGYYSIKHTDGNIMPILKQMTDCKPDAIHSLDPQGNVSIPEVRKVIGDDICLIGNVNCGLLQTGSDQECEADIIRSLNEGMAKGRGYIFSTSNCAYTGLSLERYETMVRLWKQHGNYDNK